MHKITRKRWTHNGWGECSKVVFGGLGEARNAKERAFNGGCVPKKRGAHGVSNWPSQLVRTPFLEV